MAQRMKEGHDAGQVTRYADAVIPRYTDKTSQERRLEVARTFGGIIKRTLQEPGFDYRGAVDWACEDLGIRRKA